MADIKKSLRSFIDEQKRKRREEDNQRRERNDADRSAILHGIGKDLTESLKPILPELAKSAQISKETIREALAEAIEINMPELDGDKIARAMVSPIVAAIRSIKVDVPSPQVSVNVPEIKVPQVNIPPAAFPERMSVSMDAVDRKNPLPVMLIDTKGNPFQFSFPAGLGGGGKSDFLTIKGFGQSAFSEVSNADGRIRVSMETSSSSGLTDTELRASSVPVAQVSGVGWSVSVNDVFGSTGTNIVNPDGRLKVELPTGTSGLTDAELRASAVPVSQISDGIWSTKVTEILGTAGTESMWSPDNRMKVELPTGASGLSDAELRASSVPVAQASGAVWSTSVVDVFGSVGTNVVNPDGRLKVELPATTIAGITNSVAANIVDSTGVAYSGSNPVPVSDAGGTLTVDGTVAVSDVTASLQSALIDSSGVQYSGSNPVPVTIISESLASTIAVGDIASDAADTGSAPLKIGGIARTANPTAVAAGDRVSATMDDLGRQLNRPVQVRDLIFTARVALSNGTETTLYAASAGSFHDLIYVMAANNSDAAVSLDIRAVTGGNIMLTIQVPANGTAGVAPPVPIPQDATGNNWTIDMGDITGTTVTVSALFSREV